MNILALVITLLVGLFLVIGALIIFKYEKKDKLIVFLISLVLCILSFLAIFKILPDAYANITKYKPAPFNYLVIIGFTLLGFAILKILDHFIPDHNEDKRKKDNFDYLFHIGTVFSIAVILYNIYIGINLYGTLSSSINKGLLLSIGIIFNNIVFGTFIAGTFYKKNFDKKKLVLSLSLVSIGNFLGAILKILLKNKITKYKLGILLCIILGMMIYTVIFELIPYLINYKKNLK